MYGTTARKHRGAWTLLSLGLQIVIVQDSCNERYVVASLKTYVKIHDQFGRFGCSRSNAWQHIAENRLSHFSSSRSATSCRESLMLDIFW